MDSRFAVRSLLATSLVIALFGAFAGAAQAAAVSVAAGSGHTCALEADQTVTCWGSSDFGQASVPPGLTGVTESAPATPTLARSRATAR